MLTLSDPNARLRVHAAIVVVVEKRKPDAGGSGQSLERVLECNRHDLPLARLRAVGANRFAFARRAGGDRRQIAVHAAAAVDDEQHVGGQELAYAQPPSSGTPPAPAPLPAKERTPIAPAPPPLPVPP
jgi:hypothetical protein